MITIDDLLKSPTEDEVMEDFLSRLEALSVPARSWRKGGVARTMLRVVAATYAGFSSLIVQVTKAGFLETSEGAWLTLLARYVYGVERIPATFATGKLTLVNAGGGLFNFGPREFRALSSTTKKAFTNLAGFSLGPGATLVIDVEAVEAGSSSSAAPASVTEFETTLLRVTVTNVTAIVGSEEESDVDLRQRCRDKLAALSLLGPRGAYAYAVRTAKRGDGSPVAVNRLSVSPSSSTGRVTVYVASPSGPPPLPDLDAIRGSIEAIARPDTVTVEVLAAKPVAFKSALTVWAKRTDGMSADDIQTSVEKKLEGFVASYPIGGIPKPPLSTKGYLYAEGIAGTAKSAHPSIYAIDGATSDLPLKAGEVATLAAAVDVRIVEAA